MNTSAQRWAWTGCLVTLLCAAPLTGQQDPLLVFPLLADGQGVRAEIALTNPAGENRQGTIFFWSDHGTPLTLGIGGQSVSHWDFSIPPAGALKISTDGTGPLKSGYVTIQSPDAHASLSGTIFYDIGGSQISVPASPLSSEYHVFAEKTPSSNSGLAFANPFPQPALLLLSLHDSQGVPRAAQELELPARAKTARFVDEIFEAYFESPGENFEGTVQAVSDRPFAMLGMRQRQGGSLATLSGAPTAFNSGTAQLIMSLDTGVDPSSAGVSGDHLVTSSVFQLLEISQPALQQYVHLENVSGRQPVTITLRYFNSRCEEVLSLITVLDCGESWSFRPFSGEWPELPSLEEHFFGSPETSSSLSAWDFGNGRFLLSVTVSGAGPADSDQAQTLVPQGLAGSLSCQASAPQLDSDDESVPELSLCNARPRAFNVVSGFLSGDPEGECRGPVVRANAQERFASEFTRMLTPRDQEPAACLQAWQPSACLISSALDRGETTSCGESSIAGGTWQIALPGGPNHLLPLP